MSTSPANTMTTAALQPLLRLLESKGISSRELLGSLGLDAPSVTSATQRISIKHFDQLLEQAARLLDDQAIGLAAGQRLEMPSFYLLGFLISGCQTGREALAVLRRYYALISDTRAPDFFIGQDSIKIVFYITEGTPFGSQTRSEFTAAGIHTAGQAIAGGYYQIQGVGFRHPPPSHKDRITRFFDAPVQFNQAQNWVSFSSRHLDSPLSYANPQLFAMLRAEAEQALSRFSNLKSFSQRVMHILYQWPETVPMTKDAVAELLSTSSRTLTRRLQEEDCQFSTLVKDVRLEKAKQALKSARTDVQQLALDLGFSDRRGFERAFKQWTGVTPAAYRRKQLSITDREMVTEDLD